MSLYGWPRTRPERAWAPELAGDETTAWDCRFDVAGDNAGFSSLYAPIGVNGVGSHRDPRTRAGLVINQAASLSAFGGYMAPSPPGDFMMAWRIDGVAIRCANTGTLAAYIALAASTSASTGSGTQLIGGLVHIPNNITWRTYLQKWTNWSTFSTTYTGPVQVTVATPHWLTLRREGTTWYLGNSPDLRAVAEEISVTEATLGVTPTYVGPCWYNPLGTEVSFSSGPLLVRFGPGSSTDEHLDVLSTPWKQMGGPRTWWEQPL